MGCMPEILCCRCFLSSVECVSLVGALVVYRANCMASVSLYVQGFGDKQLYRLLDVLDLGRIWACNVGENFMVTPEAWHKFADRLPGTCLAYTYVSEAHLQGRLGLKRRMRAAIRINRILSPTRSPVVCCHISNMWCAFLACSVAADLMLLLKCQEIASQGTGGQHNIKALPTCRPTLQPYCAF
jgi:hypothetical protein